MASPTKLPIPMVLLMIILTNNPFKSDACWTLVGKATVKYAEIFQSIQVMIKIDY